MRRDGATSDMRNLRRRIGRGALCVLSSFATLPHVQAQLPVVPGQFEDPRPRTSQVPAVRLSGGYMSDINADASGGERSGVAYLGKIALIADADMDRLLKIARTTAHVSFIDIHGKGLSSHFVGNLATVSGIEAEPAIRLNQLWVEFETTTKAHIRVGKFTAAQSFMTSDTAGLFINATFGWPASFATDLPSGGPSWPLAAPGVMIATPLSGNVAISGAAFAGDPAGPGEGDPQKRDGHGFNTFGFAGRPFLIGEIAASVGSEATVKAGGWVHFGAFDREGILPRSPGHGDWAVYGVADWRLSAGASGSPQLRAFFRWSVSPSDRNALALYADAGLVLTAPFRSRPDDAVGLAFARVGLSNAVRGYKTPKAEFLVELTYRATLSSAFSLQPNIQLIASPVDPSALANGIVVGHRRAIVLGLRTAWAF